MNDILCEKTEDLAFANGDVSIGFSAYEHQKNIVKSNKGEWKQHPEVGVGITAMIADDRYTEMLIEIKKQLEYDGMQIGDVTLTEKGKLNIEGKYKE
ncbi:MAG: oxidase [Capnocytophaga sp.]|nr:oxidase [Capnocytophaga sp.]